MSKVRVTATQDSHGVTLVFADSPPTGNLQSIRIKSGNGTVADVLFDLYNRLEDMVFGVEPVIQEETRVWEQTPREYLISRGHLR